MDKMSRPQGNAEISLSLVCCSHSASNLYFSLNVTNHKTTSFKQFLLFRLFSIAKNKLFGFMSDMMHMLPGDTSSAVQS